MAITNEESNVKLSTEQLLALDKYEKRMNSMRMDIDTHAKNLEALRATNAILDSDRDNLTKCIEDLKPVVEQLKVQISGLNSNIAEAQNQLERRELRKSLLNRRSPQASKIWLIKQQDCRQTLNSMLPKRRN